MSVQQSGMVAAAPERPLGLGEVMSTAWQAMRARYGLHVLVSALALLIGAVALLLWVGVAVLLLSRVAAPTGDGYAGPLVVLGAVLLLLVAVVALLAMRAEAMRVVLVRHTLDGRRPRLGDLWRDTRGYWGRVLPYFLLLLAGGLLGVVVLAVPLAVAAAGDGDRVAFGVAIGATMLLYVAYYVGVFWLTGRLYPFTVVTALERHGGMAAVGRAWGLTRGHFWRTLGYAIVGAVGPAMVIWIACVIAYVVSLASTYTSLFVTLSNLDGPGLDEQSLARLLAVTVASSLIGYLLPGVATVLVQPFVSCFSTVYVTDLARRQATPHDPPPPYGGWLARPYPPQPPAPRWGVPPAAPYRPPAPPYRPPAPPYR
ncbi:hypothetical protein GC722_02315 [Auraticoccus sp. F435]|uniref:DUF7847 domain-containing protein n=1 Tax=Auraticoccus cholistanensis TaxID=2656650 RepID=A0A6A9V064_9ACTN|nr:hypothetical protein [Auraticoccus cholistanensis]MVA74870.1 hypothetical protein [Auraticoccus cholistanensis]